MSFTGSNAPITVKLYAGEFPKDKPSHYFPMSGYLSIREVRSDGTISVAKFSTRKGGDEYKVLNPSFVYGHSAGYLAEYAVMERIN